MSGKEIAADVRSNLSDDSLRACDKFIEARWEQLNGLEKESADEGLRYLFLANGGGGVAVLAHLGSDNVTGNLPTWFVILGLFVLGLTLLGFARMFRFRHLRSLYRAWQDDVAAFNTDRLGWSELIKRDDEKAEKGDWISRIAYSSFACFILGAIVGGAALYQHARITIDNQDKPMGLQHEKRDAPIKPPPRPEPKQK